MLSDDLNIRPGVRIINHDVPKHRCPTCRRICDQTRKKPRTPGVVGRPATSADRIVEILDKYASADGPMPLDELARRLDIEATSVSTLIWRARNRGHDIRHERGYWIERRESAAN